MWADYNPSAGKNSRRKCYNLSEAYPVENQIDLQKAVAVILHKGSQVERASLRYLYFGERPSLQVVDHFLASQRPDGGWAPPWMPDYSSPDATCYHLAQAFRMGIPPGHPALQKAAVFLVQRQYLDGSWEEDARVESAAPPWAVPGELATRLYLTANCGLWCLHMQAPRHTVEKASELLLGHLDAAGKLPGFLHTHWLAASLWYGSGLVRQAELTLGYLLTRMDDLELSNLPWLITSLRSAGLPAELPLLVAAADKLKCGQLSDGSWPVEDLQTGRARPTLEALHALAQCRQIG